MVSVHREGGRHVTGRRAVVVRRQRRAALAAAAAFAVVLVSMASGVTQRLDRAATDWFRPDDTWGTAQIRLDPIIDGLQPPRAYAFLAFVTAIICLRRRSWRPAAFAALVAGTSLVLTSLVMVSTHRVDPHGYLATTGGSFPSGHVVALLASLGCCALLCWRRTRWWQWFLVAVPPAMMGTAVLYTAAHWVTDVVGGVLLAVATLCWAASWPLRTVVTERRDRVSAGWTPRSRRP
jgi:membrane-associated phospholipid phosphatase